MAFVDELTLHLKAGRGGDGVVRWRHEKGKEYSGPSGGDGGAGGDVFIRGLRDVALLARYRHSSEFEAGRGDSGMRDSKTGKSGEDFTLDLPVGAILTNRETGKQFEIEYEGQIHKVLLGGRGGQGNEQFKSSTNQTPTQWTPGTPGEEADFYIELRLFADAGFIGFPNAGKSSLLNALTNARARVASYQFTTLEPNLGDLEGFILADIPGLIEGAADGKGLGHSFLRHITRTKMLLHCVSLENEDVVAAYKTIRAELESYDATLAAKPEYIILTKTDLFEGPEAAAKIEEKAEALRRANPEIADIFSATILDDNGVKLLKDRIVKVLRHYDKPIE